MMRHWYYLLMILFFSEAILAASDEPIQLRNTPTAPPSIGNFSLPPPQQPGPLVAFGQNLIGKNQLQLFYNVLSIYPLFPGFKNTSASMVYGFTEETSLFFNYPLTADTGSVEGHNLTLKQITTAVEYALYLGGNTRYQDQWTLVGALTIPLNTITLPYLEKEYSGPAYFLGTTYNRTYVDWYFFGSAGALLPTTQNNFNYGNQYYYQGGVGYNLIGIPNESTLFGLVELDGQYIDKNLFLHQYLPNTGGNTLYMTPSITFATKKILIDVGVGFPLIQRLFGDQVKTDYFLAASFTYTVT